jgi:hypothetical protein
MAATHHRAAAVDDGAGAEEADAAHDAVGDARRIDGDVDAAGERPVPVAGGEGGGDDHHQRRTERHQQVGAKAGLASPDFPFQPHKPPGDGRQNEAEDLFERPAQSLHPFRDGRIQRFDHGVILAISEFFRMRTVAVASRLTPAAAAIAAGGQTYRDLGEA